MAKMTASKKDRTEHDLDALTLKIPEVITASEPNDIYWTGTY